MCCSPGAPLPAARPQPGAAPAATRRPRCLSQPYFSWVTPIVRRAWSTRLAQEDVSLRSSTWVRPHVSSTDELLAAYDSLDGTFRRRLWLLVRRRLLYCAGLLICYCALQLSLPLLLRGAVRAVEGDDPDGFWYAIAIGAALFASALCKEHQMWISYNLGAEMRSLSAALVYRSAMSLKQYELQPATSNLITVDAQKFTELMPLFNWLWAAPMQIAAAVGILVALAGPAALAGVGVLVLLIPINRQLMAHLRAARGKHLPIADKRVALCNEAVKGMRVLKLNGWDEKFEELVLERREAERQYLRTMLKIFAASMSFTIIVPQVSTAIAFLSATLADPLSPLTADEAFPVLALFSAIRFPLLYLADALYLVSQASVALRRLDAFLTPTLASNGDGGVDDSFKLMLQLQPVAQHEERSRPRRSLSQRIREAAGVAKADGGRSSSRAQPPRDADATPCAAATNEADADGVSGSPVRVAACPAGDEKAPAGAANTLAGTGGVGEGGSEGADAGGVHAGSVVVEMRDMSVSWSKPQHSDSSHTGAPLAKPEAQPTARKDDKPKWGRVRLGVQASAQLQSAGRQRRLKLDGASASPLAGSSGSGSANTRTSRALTDVSISLRAGQMLLVAGPVGSGKSTLLAGLLGEALREGHVKRPSHDVALCTQSAWVQNMSIRDNILFSRPWDLDLYRRVVEGCCLAPDFAALPNSDRTIIGERGVTLSGGQKQRIALARATYARPRLVLLDDCFSALDGPTGKAVFEALFTPRTGLLADAACILVSHATQYAMHASAGVLLLHDGRPVARGTVQQLRALGEASRRSRILVRTDVERSGSLGRLTVAEAEALEGFLSSLGANNAGGGSAAEGTSPGSAGVVSAGGASSDALEAELEELEGKRRVSLDELLKSNQDEAAADFKQEETDEESKLGWRTLLRWISAAGGWCFVVPLALFFLCERSTYILLDFWLTAWSDAGTPGEEPAGLAEAFGLGTIESKEDNLRYMYVYLSLMLINSVFAFARTTWFAIGGVKAAFVLFSKMLRSILGSPMRFFDVTPVGRITNRLTYDTDIVDVIFVQKGLQALASTMWTASSLAVLLWVVPWILAALVPLALVYYFVHIAYTRSGVQLQRLHARSQSPLLSHVEESVSGAAAIRAFGVARRFARQFAQLNDETTVSFLAFAAVGRWLAMRLETIGTLASLSVTLACWALRNELSGSFTGLAIIWSFNLTISLSFLVHSFSEFESKGVSLERVVEYGTLPSEAPRHIEEATPPPSWPTEGCIRFAGVTLRYRPTLPPALHDFSATIHAQEHVGIVGRTGAGKSTVAVALFRLVEADAGRIVVDGIDLRGIGLADVRGRRAGLAIIPQDPLLFSGSVRRSLDPLNDHEDNALWEALGNVGMADAIRGSDGGLEAPAAEGGTNFSLGERQLLCFARSLLRRPKILVLDEATASVDHATDERIQATIRRSLQHATLLTVAHRLHTIMDYHRVLVLSQGRCAEAGVPHELLQQPNSALSALVDGFGERAAARLRQIAADARRS